MDILTVFATNRIFGHDMNTRIIAIVANSNFFSAYPSILATI